MKASQVLSFQKTATALLRNPWQKYKDGTSWYRKFPRGSKRHPLTTKQGNKHFYKGTGSSGYGRLNSAGVYIIDWSKVRTYVVPSDLQSEGLKALVSPTAPQIYQQYVGYQDGVKSAELAWKNVVDFIEYGQNYNDQDLEANDYKEEFINPKVIKSEQVDLEGSESIIKKD
ncbi:hypothetical protein HYPBUDRAFT_152520 [Hyphopichia burtonii NRRL Y-1933]|uniref:Uncharacterized protein n=1 Tax=Hyphopichia burtonii NRRL Y-1933 TaxID=984485 RepID=A0A1E4RK76_9ASCO|nr:hypothetical protein HYPBUDRAFT_152520 [Hyphopichia burtonii NRRL Y-1933]ODV67684.1 hypothetical protein HYPBUDRAFT_152520 [Hyphopichia burtonii NRRL Y-1933]